MMAKPKMNMTVNNKLHDPGNCTSKLSSRDDYIKIIFNDIMSREGDQLNNSAKID